MTAPQEPTRHRLRTAGRAVTALAGRAPLTLAYVGVLGGTSVWLHTVEPDTRVAVLQTASTNLDNLREGHWSVLVTSAGVLLPPLGPTLAVAATILVAGEVLLGRSWAAVTFISGHVGASLAVAGLLLADALPGVLAETAGAKLDVGVSYGTLAVLGTLAATRPAQWPAMWCAGVLAMTAAPLGLTDPTVTRWGHAAAAVLGVLLGAGLRWRRDGAA